MTALGATTRRVAFSIPNVLARDGMDVIVLATSKDPNAKATALLFPPFSSQPVLAIKIPTTAEAASAVEREVQVLHEIRARVSSAALPALPCVVDVADTAAGSAFVMTALPGRSMAATYNEWGHTSRRQRVAADMRLAGRWLTQFQAATEDGSGPLDLSLHGTLLDRLDERFGQRPGFRNTIAAVGGCLRRLTQASTPKTAVHGDFWIGNLLVANGQITGVVDWEHGESRGEPVRDIVRFALTYALYLDRHTKPGRRVRGHGGLRAGVWGAGASYAVDGRGWFPDVFQTFVGDHLERLGVPRSAWRDGVTAGVAEIAVTADDRAFAGHHADLLGRFARADD